MWELSDKMITPNFVHNLKGELLLRLELDFPVGLITYACDYFHLVRRDSTTVELHMQFRTNETFKKQWQKYLVIEFDKSKIGRATRCCYFEFGVRGSKVQPRPNYWLDRFFFSKRGRRILRTWLASGVQDVVLDLDAPLYREESSPCP